MLANFHHLFFLKRDIRNMETVPIYLRITVSGKRAEMSLDRKVSRYLWIKSQGRIEAVNKVAKEINKYLNLIEGKVYEAYESLVRRGEVITALKVKNRLKGIDDEPKMLVGIFQKHNRRIAALVPVQYAAGTLERYKTSLSHTVEFVKWKYGSSDIDVKQIDPEFIADYDLYLRTVRKCSNNTTVKYLKNFRKIIRICLANGWIDSDPFVLYKAKIKTVYPVCLDEQELRAIIAKIFVIDRLNQVKDIFLFSCFTGLAYADVAKLTIENIVIGVDSQKWLSFVRTKTRSMVNVPLLQPALRIIDKYSGQAKLLPVLSNQKMNGYLKEIADICGIKKRLTFHVARHTFATTVTLNNNVPIESVSKMLGHKSIATTEHYAKLMDTKVGRDMLPLYEKF
ncbi:site-specific integrase [Taibaiella soli]|uniref:Site-specific integrase n=1 Tax=Taibaiella soli TaxID=1649169 RepID=A0A2W2ACC6_9BACT|nr:site-specific integrase [Taibaiella soli]PZF71272.1 site-specific integrase [Taibaiella soli]